MTAVGDPAEPVLLFLCGDVMPGRGVDQILRHPSRPILYEPAVKSALEYVALAEYANGPIPRAVGDDYVWGVALDELDRRRPDARIVNLETSVTTSDSAAPKGINYRMHPANAGFLAAARVDCAVLANNHVLDWGTSGLVETLDTLAGRGIRTCGAGRTTLDATAPAVLERAGGGGRTLVFAWATPDAGVPAEWSATPTAPGVAWIGDYSLATAEHISGVVAARKRTGDVAVLSIHWGSNWGYEIPHEHRRFAHALIDAGAVDVVWGHSSHHAKGVEVYRGRPILYGCGDFLNDYEGIHGAAGFRDDLAVMYFPALDSTSGALVSLELVPLVIRKFRLEHPAPADARWLRDTLDRECRRLGTRLDAEHGRWTLGFTA